MKEDQLEQETLMLGYTSLPYSLIFRQFLLQEKENQFNESVL